jgi:hypothetical protein
MKILEVEMLPCPFCGNTESIELTDSKYFYQDDEDIEYEIICSAERNVVENICKDGCGASSGFSPTQFGAIEKWNTRK